MPNRLADESSPYLLQHQNNPVDWYPWDAEALVRARAEGKPIFLSIGYSACHWCHVMEHESFESEEIAELLNERFICVKVDREERPDLDQIYMNAVQMMTGQGGWPMSVFLTPDLKPFFAGTYFPPTQRMGMPGFPQVIEAVHDAWTNRRDAVLGHSEEITARLASVNESAVGNGQVQLELLQDAVRSLERIFDFRNGGFGSAPKFPHCMDLQLLLRMWQREEDQSARKMVELNLDKMARGGIYDHLAGGFARYSVDPVWLVPHFEKMLYDNALLAGIYLDASVALQKPFYAQVARETLDYILQYMTDPAGGFHSTEDADSEGEEGKFYVWTPSEIRKVLGDDMAARFGKIYDVTDAGNFEGKNVLNLTKPIEQLVAENYQDVDEGLTQLIAARAKLLQHRDQRIRPGKDDKVLVSWNALMIGSMALGGVILDDQRYLDAAIKATEFIFQQMVREDGRLLHSWRHGKAKLDAYLDDYTYLINACTILYQTTFQERWIEHAVKMATVVMEHFRDESRGGFYFTSDDHEQLITRNKDVHDSSVPSGNSMAATALLRLSKLTSQTQLAEAAVETIGNSISLMEKQPSATGQMLVAADFLLGPAWEFVLVAENATEVEQALVREFQQAYLPNAVIAYRDLAVENRHSCRQLDALFHNRQAEGGRLTLYVCRQQTCQPPVSDRDAIREILENAKKPAATGA